MLKRTIRWLLPLIALLMFAAYLIIAPIMATHAAPAVPAPAMPSISAPHRVSRIIIDGHDKNCLRIGGVIETPPFFH